MSAPNEWQRASAQRLTGRLLRQTHAAQRLNSLRPEGRLQRVVGLTLEVVGCRLPIGARVTVDTADGPGLDADVVGFAAERTSRSAARRVVKECGSTGRYLWW